MTKTDTTPLDRTQSNPSNPKPSMTFLLDANFGLNPDEKPWSDILPAAGIKTISSTDLPWIDELVANHEPDIAFIPIADFQRAPIIIVWRQWAPKPLKVPVFTMLPLHEKENSAGARP